MNNYFFYRTRNAIDREFMDRSPNGGMSRRQDPVRRDEHPMSFARQVRNVREHS